jgi:hypothetical protein
LLIGTTTADASGKWSFTPNLALPEGQHSFTAIAVTIAGRESAPTAAFALEIDTIAPGKPGTGGNGSIDQVSDDKGANQGPVANGGSTDDPTPTLSGSGQTPGDTVIIKDNGIKIGHASVNEAGRWVFTHDTPLNEGPHKLTIIVKDAAGNASQESEPYKVIIDTTSPAKATINSVVGNQGHITGNLTSGDACDDAQPVINGTAESRSSVIIYDNGEGIGRVRADESGNWSFTPELPLQYGVHSLEVIVLDDAGNYSSPSDSFEFELISSGVPSAPAFTGITDDVGPQQGNLSPGSITDDNRPTLHGTGERGSTITLHANGVLLGTTVVGVDSLWSFTPSTDLISGLNILTATATNAWGSQSPASAVIDITVDVIAAETGLPHLMDSAVAIGNLSNRGVTDDPTLKLSLDDVLNNSTTDLFHESGKLQMMTGAEGTGSWATQGQVNTGGGIYEAYRHSLPDNDLLVQQGVTTNLV